MDILRDASDVAVRLGFAVAAGAIIGLNRWLHHKPAGVGTHALVALGAALATVLVSRTADADAQAMSRVIQGLVTGVGFIGAGVIMRTDDHSRVQGLTTAATVWTSAILGIACGTADFAVGTVAVAFTLGVLLVGKRCEDLIGRMLGARDEDGSPRG